MKIYGVVAAKHEKQADAILMDLVNENILDYYELDGREDLDYDEINSKYDAVVDNEGYLTTGEEYTGDLTDLLYNMHGLHTYSFEAECLGV